VEIFIFDKFIWQSNQVGVRERKLKTNRDRKTRLVKTGQSICLEKFTVGI
jgi:hypothetical protein